MAPPESADNNSEFTRTMVADPEVRAAIFKDNGSRPESASGDF